MRSEPFRLDQQGTRKRSSSLSTSSRLLPNKIRQQEPVVNLGAPAHKILPVRLLPEARNQRAEQKMLCETHPRMRRHLKRPHFQQSEAPGRRFRCIELVNAKFRTVRVSGSIDQNIAENAID